jgi:hypothetical protein
VPKVRAYGADAMLKACRETSYGVAPLTGYRSLLGDRRVAEQSRQLEQQVVSRPDQRAVVGHPSTLADIERKKNVL